MFKNQITGETETVEQAKETLTTGLEEGFQSEDWTMDDSPQLRKEFIEVHYKLSELEGDEFDELDSHVSDEFRRLQ